MTATPEQDMPESHSPWQFEECVNRFALKPDEILAPHRRQTIERMKTHETVLCTLSSIDCDDLQVVGADDGTRAVGSRLHATFAWNTAGIPIGVLRSAFSTKSKRVKTQLWRDGLRDIDKAAKTMPLETRVFCILDWNSEIYDLLAAHRGLERTEVLLRAIRDPQQERIPDRLFKAMRNCPLAGEIELSVQRGVATEEKPDGANHDTPIRFELHLRTIALSPVNPKAGALVRVSTIYLREKAPPEGADGMEWYLVTTAALDSLDSARKLAKYYVLSSHSERIMEFFTSGCQTEGLRFGRASWLHRMLTLNLVVAWRVLLIFLLGTLKGESHPWFIFTEEELEVLSDYAQKCDIELVNLASAIQIMIILGGSTEEDHEWLTTHEVLWRGYKLLRLEAGDYEDLDLKGFMT